MPRKKEKTAVDLLAEQADDMLKVAWVKLKSKEITREDIEKMVDGWNLKHEVHVQKAEEKQLNKEAKQSDEG